MHVKNSNIHSSQVSGAVSAHPIEDKARTQGGSPSVHPAKRPDSGELDGTLFSSDTTGTATAAPRLRSLTVDELKAMTPSHQYQCGIRYLHGVDTDQDTTRAYQCLLMASDLSAAQFSLGEMHARGIGREVNHQKAISYYQRAAWNGNANALAALGNCHELGLGTVKDFTKAIAFYDQAVAQGNLAVSGKLQELRHAQSRFTSFEEAAVKGDAQAQYQLGCCFERGEGVDKNEMQALAWWRIAARQGEKEAQFALGQSCETKNKPEDAAEWYRKAALQGHAQAQFQLAQCYDSGIGLPRDKEEARTWFEKAALQGLAKAQVALAHAYEMLGSGVGSEYVEAPVEERAKALEWYKKAAEQNDLDGLNGLYAMYWTGAVVKQDLPKAKEVLEKWSGLGGVEATRWLAEGYLTGELGVKDSGKALEWFEKWAAMGGPEAMLQLASYFEGGAYIKPKKDPVKAFEWYEKAALAGSSEAQHTLALLYEQGLGVDKNAGRAFEWYEKAAEGGRPEHQYALGLCYLVGTGVPENAQRALELIRRAAGQEYHDARVWLNQWQLERGLKQ